MDAERPDPPARRAAVEEPLVRASDLFAREDSPRPSTSTESERAGPRPSTGLVPSNACDWASVQAAAAESRRQVKMVVEEATLIEFKDGCANLSIAPDLMTAAAGVQEEIRQLVGRTWGQPVRIEFAQAATHATVVAAVAAHRGAESEPKDVQAQGPSLTVVNATDNPLIAKAVELFGAKVLGVYPRQK